MDPISIGKVKIHILEDGVFRLDAGVLFGFVPKILWEKALRESGLFWEWDEKANLLTLSSRGFLVEKTDGQLILVDTGFGEKFFGLLKEHMSITRPNGSLLENLRKLGINRDDVTAAVNTHLHADHAGGNVIEEGGVLRPAFPNAFYYIQEREWKVASTQNTPAKGAYFREHLLPLEERRRTHLYQGKASLGEGITLFPTPGHTPGHQSVLIESEGKSAVVLGAVGITALHLENLRWGSSLDYYRDRSWKTKQKVVKLALEKKALVFFAHDPQRSYGYLEEIEKGEKYRVVA